MAVTGGWIDLGESPEQTASREVAEETGLGLNELRCVGLTNNKFSDQDRSISINSRANIRIRNKLITANPADANSGYGCNGRNYKIIYIYHYNY